MNSGKVTKPKTEQDRQTTLRNALAKKAAQLKLQYDATTIVKPVDSSMIKKIHTVPAYNSPIENKPDPYFDGQIEWEDEFDDEEDDKIGK